MRKILGSLVILTFLAVYIALAVMLGGMLQGQKILSLIFYVIAGIAWALPLKPVLQWMHAKDKPLPSSEI